jgi:hypothetical protein
MTKKFFGEQRIHYDFIDVDVDKDGLAFVEKVNNGKQIIPTLVFEDGSTLADEVGASMLPERDGHGSDGVALGAHRATSQAEVEAPLVAVPCRVD